MSHEQVDLALVGVTKFDWSIIQFILVGGYQGFDGSMHNVFKKCAYNVEILFLCPNLCYNMKMPKIDTLDALEEHEEHEDDYQTNSN